MSITLDRQELKMNWPKSPATASASVGVSEGSDGSLRVNVAVNDRALRETLGAFDGLERPVALVSDGNEMKRFPLRYIASVGGSGTTPVVDHYELLLGKGQFDPIAAMLQGVAIVLETNNTQVWLQKQDDNYKAVPL